MITVNGKDVSMVHVRYDGKTHDVFAKDIGEFNGDQAEFFNAVEAYLDFSIGALNGYELDIIEETGNAICRPQAKFEAILKGQM